MNTRSYWRENLQLVASCLTIWFFASFGCGILFTDWLNHFQVGGFRLGFWFSQQGSIYIFVGLIFYYARRMATIDRRHGVDEH